MCSLFSSSSSLSAFLGHKTEKGKLPPPGEPPGDNILFVSHCLDTLVRYEEEEGNKFGLQVDWCVSRLFVYLLLCEKQTGTSWEIQVKSAEQPNTMLQIENFHLLIQGFELE